ncbi:MAG: hypothetical protein HFG67_01575, partial [Firmicutes bacterium]|nr:hypothetical protein [Bacillota bacterium]
MAKEKINFEDEQVRHDYRHTASHIMAQAVKHIWPEAKLAIGPAIENGFYYDFDLEHKFTEEDFLKIQKEMKKIVQANYKLERFKLPRAEAIALMQEKDEPYKVELINDLPEDAVISFYKQGDFTDLCAGPHMESTGQIKAFKLERFELPRAEAIALMQEKDEPYKVELINDLPEDAVISFYKQGDFTDLC